MILPAIFEYTPQQAPPRIGEHGEWHLFWNAGFADLWAGLRPDWRLSVALRPRHDQPAAPMVGQKQTRLPATATSGEVQIDCHVYGSVPENITLAGAVRITGRAGHTASGGQPERSVTAATVTRMQLVSIVIDYRPMMNIDNPDPARQYENLQPIAGTEWFSELAQPPLRLHTYRPHVREPGQLRKELLLLDLDTTT